MSRNNKKSVSAIVNTDKGSHPQEKDPNHRRFLMRSLDRNDVELTALAELNKSLRKAREQILESCGELVLLDLGVGRLTLINDELHEEKSTGAALSTPAPAAPAPATTSNTSSAHNSGTNGTANSSNEVSKSSTEAVTSAATVAAPPSSTTSSSSPTEEVYSLTPAQKSLCVDFLLRMKLRRKLANRLARRLNRIAQAMDGTDVSPPLPPRYGDLRLNIDPVEVQKHKDLWERKEKAKAAIAKAKQMAKQSIKGEDLKPPKAVPSSNKEDTDAGNAQPEEALSTAADAESTSAVPKSSSAVESTTHAPNVNEEGKANSDGMNQDGASSVMPAESSADAVKSDGRTNGQGTVDTTPNPQPATSQDSSKEMNGSPPNKTSEPTSNPDVVESNDSNTTTVPFQSEDPDTPSLQDEYEVLREHEVAYEKVWNSQLRMFQYVISNQEFSADYTQIKAGAGIGAHARFSSEQEREQEYRRWQTSILSRIPQQPTFAELGLKNRVFCLEERRKRCLEEISGEDESDDVNTEKQSPTLEESSNKRTKLNDENGGEKPKDETEDMSVDEKKESDAPTAEDEKEPEEKPKAESENDDKAKDDSDDSSDMFEDDEDGDGDKKVQKTADDENSKSENDDIDDDDNDDNSEDDGEDKDNKEDQQTSSEKKTIKLQPRKKEEEKAEEKPAETVVEEPIRIRPMSLAAVPSFHEQDMLRIRTVHGDLLGSSILEHSRRRMSEATQEYNDAFRLSNQVFEHRTRLQQNLNYFLTKSRQDQARVNSEHGLQVAIAKQQWIKQKREHDKNRVKQFLPSSWGRSPFGTTATQNYQRRGGMAAVVASCMADIVDGALIALDGKLPNKKFDDFIPPRPPHANQATGESLAQQHSRMEQELRRQINDCGVKLAQSEEARKRAWKKMMKLKAELEPATASYGRARIDLTNYHQVPVPPLRNSTQQALPREFVSRAAVATYTPPRSTVPPPSAGTSDSKYSAARVRERISSDGTVAPVTDPKKTKDGLYMRPAGRTRKGMQWDAVRGIWVPQGSQ